MLFSLLYLILRRVLGAGRRPQDEMDIELLVLRHQVKVLRRHVKGPRLRRLDRVLLAAASRAMPRSIWSSPARATQSSPVGRPIWNRAGVSTSARPGTARVRSASIP